MSKPILCLDFDGVCHLYTSGWVNAWTISDDPVPGLFDFLEEAQKRFRVAIYSSRSEFPHGRDAMREWFQLHAMGHYTNRYEVDAVSGDEDNWERVRVAVHDVTDKLEFPTAKPAAFITLDDRALTFTGIFPAIEQLQSFKPWNDHLKVKK